MRKIILIILIVYLYLITIFIFPLVMIPFTYVRAEFNQGELERIVTDLTKDCTTDEEKTKSLLNWFDRYSGNIYNTWGSFHIGPFYFGGGKIFDFIICLRINERKPPLFVLTSRCGSCGEHGALFTEMAKEAGLEVRTVVCKGIDHVWAEVKVNGTWIIVEPANVVHQNNRSGYNISAESYEKGHAGRTKNISYIFAEYPDGRIEDITDRYTNLSHINITTVDENNNPVPNVEVSVISYNRFDDGADTWRTFSTDENGNYQLDIGGGDIKLAAKSKHFIPLYTESRNYYHDNEYQDVVLTLKNDWTKNNYLLGSLIIILIVIIMSISYYYRRKKHA